MSNQISPAVLYEAIVSDYFLFAVFILVLYLMRYNSCFVLWKIFKFICRSESKVEPKRKKKSSTKSKRKEETCDEEKDNVDSEKEKDCNKSQEEGIGSKIEDKKNIWECLWSTENISETFTIDSLSFESLKYSIIIVNLSSLEFYQSSF